jgi:hypothetical protein
MIKTPAVWGVGRGPKDYIAVIMTDAVKSGAAEQSGVTICHEVGHGFGMNHRHLGTALYDDNVKTSGLIPMSATNANAENVMWPSSNGISSDWGLVQAIGISGCELQE